jgi:polyvinyl alcohol dehydrogenase (cytochrome)
LPRDGAVAFLLQQKESQMLNVKGALRAGAVALCAALGGAALAADWPTAGRDLRNSRYQSDEKRISPRTVGQLTLRWQTATDGDVTANPAVDGNFLYFPDSAGFLYKLDKNTGAIVWKNPIASYTGIPGDFARATPAVAGDLLILGNQSGKLLGAQLGQAEPQAARVFAVNKNTGAAVWSTQVDPTARSFVTHSAIVANGTAIVGTASNEELVAAFVPKAFWQWQFRGSVVALDVATGAIKWVTYTVPLGYYGGAVWGSTGAVDLGRNHVYMATGNNYAVPDEVLACLTGGASAAMCISADNHVDSIVAMDLSTGAVKWAARGLPHDIWNVACGLTTPGFVVGPGFPGVFDNCPNGNPATAGPDWDFAQGPMLFADSGRDVDTGLVGAGQKSGVFWAFRAKDGKLVWSRQVAPGGVTGGLQWGSASDGERIYVAVANSGPSSAGGGVGALPWTLKDGSVTTAGGWAALEAKTGDVVWTTKDPQGSRSEAAVSGANGVIFGCNLAPGAGTMYALDAKSGAPLWSYNSGGACNAGPAISDGMVYWGSGTFVSPGGPKKLFAFGL